jgi:hypothetical protein
MYKGILIMDKLHFWLFFGLISTTFGCFAGQLPEGFKFEKASDTQRTCIMTQLSRFEECKGDEDCIEKLKALENSVLVAISREKVQVTNNTDVSVIVRYDSEAISIQDKGK